MSVKAKRSLCLCLFIVFLCVVASSIYTATFFYRWLKQPLNIPTSISSYKILPGDSLISVASRLHRDEILEWPKIWVIYGKYFASSQIHIGEFQLKQDINPVELLALFQSSNYVQYSVTIVEGMTIDETVTRLQNQKKLKKVLPDNFDASRTVLPDLNYPHLEGWFFPDTYYYSAGDTDLSILQRANKRLVKVLDEEWENRASSLPYTSPYQALIMASIIEKETGAPHERAQIAGVFVRRMQKGMKLQTDPSVIYGLGSGWDGNITRADLKNPHAYNTYVHSGLPPTPIALVGREAIHAALNPKDGSSLFFVAKGDGTHYFSDTFEQHQRAVREYQLKRREGYRSNYRKEASAQKTKTSGTQ